LTFGGLDISSHIVRVGFERGDTLKTNRMGLIYTDEVLTEEQVSHLVDLLLIDELSRDQCTDQQYIQIKKYLGFKKIY
jgi:hypothetical protein